MLNFFKSNFKAFENARVLSTAIQIGIRESRKIIGEYVPTNEDCLSLARFEDAVAVSNYDIDIHNPEGSGTSHYYFPDGQWYTIPYRSLIPRAEDCDNLLVGGRCISCDHEAQASIRIMPICATLGEAAGVAAAVAKLGYDLSEEDTEAVYNEFVRVAAKKTVGAKELEAIVSGVAMQVPPTYTLVSYMVNSSGGNALVKASLDYAYPIYMGDIAIANNFMYIRRLTVTPHFDITATGMGSLYSVGTAVQLDMKSIFWIGAPVSVGLTYSYNGGSAFAEFGKKGISLGHHYIGPVFSVSLPN